MRRLLFGFAILLAGCGVRSDSSGSVSVPGRTISYSLEGGGSMDQNGDGTECFFEGGNVSIQKARVLLEGTEVAKLPADAKVVAVDYAGGTLKVSADGAKVYEKKFDKK